MHKLYFIVLMLIIPFIAPAQNYYFITHNSGTEVIHGTSIKVTKMGTPITGKGFCGVSGYWIGYGASNAYTFTFHEQVKHLRLRVSAINRGELVAISVNGKKHRLYEENTHTYQGECMNIPEVAFAEGQILSNYDYTNAETDLDVKEGIDSISVTHVNGNKGGAGVVFDIAIVDDGLTAGAGNGLGAGTTGITNIALQTGMFYMQPNPAEKIVNLAFLPSSSGTATVVVTDMAGRKVLMQSYDCNKGVANYSQLDVGRFVPGNYMVELMLNEEHYIEKLVKL